MFIPAVAGITLALFTATWAAESSDVQQVRGLLYKEQQSYIKGDVEQLVSCYAPDFVGHGWGPDPAIWRVDVVSLDSLRAQYGGSAQKAAAWWARHPEWDGSGEVLHVHVKADRAIALTKHWGSVPDSTARRPFPGQCSSWYVETS
ncbi:MAG: hypothetical protein HYW07_08420 [Candidatus Latescibacteria bacterium]|nr:hypothetical protein [Candidatus Latescibacterota bacterium]